MDFFAYLKSKQSRIENFLAEVFTTREPLFAPFYEMLRYPLEAKGKYARPALTLMTNELLGGSDETALPAACALECVHAYSLVHDDLPSMDNDDMRRGRATTHVRFGEGNAILVGDALLTRAFSLATEGTPSNDIAVQIVRELALAAGAQGMVGGQYLDLANEGKEIEFETLKTIHAHKTGALIRCACRMGATLANANEAALAALTAYGEHIGLAFQIQDDILDVVSTSETLGKSTGKDAASNKATYVKFFGVEGAREKAAAALSSAIEALAPFGDDARYLADFARYIVERAN